MLWHSAASCKVSQFSQFFAFFPGNYWFHLHQTLIFVYVVSLCSHLQCFQIFFTFLHFSQELLVWSSSNFDFRSCCGTLQPGAKFLKVLTFWHLFLGTTGVDLDQIIWFLFMLWHSAANCKVSKFSHFFAFFWRTTGLHQTLIFVHAVAFCSHLQCFHISFTFLHFSQELLVSSWSIFWFLFMLWHCATNCKVSKFSQFFAFFSGTTGLILIKLWFLFMLWHSAATCNVSKFPSLFCIFLKNYWSSSNIDFCSCCGILQPIAKFHKFLSFWHFSQELLVSSSSNFDFCLCCFTLQPLAMFPNFLHFFAYFSGTIGVILIKLLFLFMLCHSAAIVKFQNFFTFLHFSKELLVWSWSNFIFVYAVAFCSQL